VRDLFLQRQRVGVFAGGAQVVKLLHQVRSHAATIAESTKSRAEKADNSGSIVMDAFSNSHGN
jgi:hypothetical protein